MGAEYGHKTTVIAEEERSEASAISEPSYPEVVEVKRKPGRPRLRKELLVIPLGFKVGQTIFTYLQLIEEYHQRPYPEILRDQIDKLVEEHKKDRDFLRWLRRKGISEVQ